jgi:hypothetical protein
MAICSIDDDSLERSHLFVANIDTPLFAKTVASQKNAAPQIDAIPTIKQAESLAFPQSYSRPILPNPKKNAIADLIHFQLDMDDTTSKIITSSAEDLKQNQEDIKRIEEKRRAALEEEVKSVQSRSTWSTLAKVSTYILNVGSLMTGNYLLIAAGSIGLFNNLAHDTGLINKVANYTFISEETKEKYIKGFDALSIILQVGLSLSGSVFAWNQGLTSKITGIEALEKVSTIVTTAATITGLASGFKASAHQNEIAKIRATIKELDGELLMKNQDAIPKRTKRMIDATEYRGQEAADARKAIDLLYG